MHIRTVLIYGCTHVYDHPWEYMKHKASGTQNDRQAQGVAGSYHVIIHWNLAWETTAFRDHLSWRTTSYCQKVLHFSINEPVTRDHLSWETIFLWPMGRSVKTGSTVTSANSWQVQEIQFYVHNHPMKLRRCKYFPEKLGTAWLFWGAASKSDFRSDHPNS